MPRKKEASKPATKKQAGSSKSVDEQKAQALNLFEEEEKKEKSPGKKKTASRAAEGSVYGHLGKSKSATPASRKTTKKASAKKTAATKTAAKKTAAKEEESPSAPAKEAAPAKKKVEAIDLIAEEPKKVEAAVEEPPPAPVEEDDDEGKVINIKPPIVVKDLAERMGLKPFKLIKDLMELDTFVNPNQSIEPDIAAQVCEKHGFVFEKEKREKGAGVHKVEEVIEEPEAPAPEEVEEEELKLRPPVVTFMGHVDHGKTSLLDAYRGSRVVSGEAGGITQHIGAYQVTRDGKAVTFIDTPGHAAFSEMRARGANVTDIVVLVVAADDGLMPTTFEAIDHCRAAGVTIIVAINKIDLDRADPNKVKGQLQENDLSPEDWGGETIVVEVSAKDGTGLDDLFEMIHLQAEVLELKANPEASARAIVIEGRTEPGKGPTATAVVQSGTLKNGSAFICGEEYGKVKALVDDQGKRLKEAGPAMPVEIIGFSGVPQVGDELVEMDSERNAKKLSDERKDQRRRDELQPQQQKSALETLFANIEDGKKTVLKLIIKADVQGSLQAIEKSLADIESKKISLDIIRKGVGPITEADVILASASDAILIGFSTKVENKAQPVVKREGVQVKLFSIIYELIDQVKEAMLGLLEPETREHIIGHAKVLEVFKLSHGKVGGCVVTDGRINNKARARVLRDKVPIYDGGLSTLRRFKDDVKEVKNGLECGIKLGNFNDYAKDDIIECYELEKLEQTL